MRIKLNLSFKNLSYTFKISKQTTSNIFYSILKYSTAFKPVSIDWMSKEKVVKTMPDCFKLNYPDTRVIIDCTEMTIQSPSKQSEQAEYYSHYKGQYTVKFMIGIAPVGRITFLSKVYPGRVSDAKIFKESNLVSMLESGDKIMADKGFPDVKLQEEQITIIPPRAKRNQEQFSKEELENCKKIASARIHVERVIQRIKIFNILNNVIPRNLLPVMPQIISVCAMAANLGKPIIKTMSSNDEEVFICPHSDDEDNE